MKPKFTVARNYPQLIIVGSAIASIGIASAATKTWDGGGGNGNWSTGANWDLDTAPSATGDILNFVGTTNLSAVNDSVTALATSGTAITFASGAGSFNLSGNAITMGSGGGGGQTIITQNSANNQTISLNINLSGGNGDRSIVFGSGAGSLTLSGNINFNGDWLFPTTTAGTLILSGTNTGDGKATNAITAGTNIMRAMMRNNVAGTALVLGSDGALANSGSGSAPGGTASFRGIIANQNMTLGTANGDRNLSGSSLAINAGNIDFNGTSNLTIGNIINVAGNRDFLVSSTGAVTVSNGLFLSQDQTGRRLYVNLTGAGGMVVNGAVSDTFHSSGLTTAGSSTLQKAGSGTLTLNGNSSYTGATIIDAGTLKIGNVNALGATGTSISTTTLNSATLDLNGFSIGETVNTSGTPILANSSGTAATLTADMNLNSDLTVNTSGDITATRFIGLAVPRTITKLGNGTLTTNGSSHNNLANWQINAGTVVFANTSGFAADRGVTIAGGTLKLSGANSNLVNDGQSFTLNSGTFDLNGKSEAVASIGGSGGTIRNNLTASTSTLYVGGGVSGTSSASFAGAIVNGNGTMALTKEGSGTQTLTGTNTYTGATVISAGTLALGAAGSINNTSGVSLGTVGTFDVSAKSGYTVSNLSGSGSVIGALTVSSQLAIGNSPGTVNFSSNLTLGAASTYLYELTGGGNTADLGDLAGALSIVDGAILDLVQLGTYTANNKFTLFAYDGAITGTFRDAGNTPLADGATFTDAGGVWVIDYNDTTAGLNGGTGSSYVTITAVPEPAAALLGGLGLLALIRRRRD